MLFVLSVLGGNHEVVMHVDHKYPQGPADILSWWSFLQQEKSKHRRFPAIVTASLNHVSDTTQHFLYMGSCTIDKDTQPHKLQYTLCPLV